MPPGIHFELHTGENCIARFGGFRAQEQACLRMGCLEREASHKKQR